MAIQQNQTHRMSFGESLKKLAAERAQILVGCYRKSDVGDPQVYSAAVIAVLAQWPAEVIIAVTEPTSGIPSQIAWLPSIAEIASACKHAYEPIRARLEIEKTRKALPPPPVSEADRARVSGLLHGLAEELKAKSRRAGFADPKIEAQKILDRYEREALEKAT